MDVPGARVQGITAESKPTVTDRAGLPKGSRSCVSRPKTPPADAQYASTTGVLCTVIRGRLAVVAVQPESDQILKVVL